MRLAQWRRVVTGTGTGPRCDERRLEVHPAPAIPSRSASTRNATAKSLPSVSLRSRFQSIRSRTARNRGRSGSKSQWCSFSDKSFCVSTVVGDSTRHGDGEYVVHVGRFDHRLVDRHAVYPVKHIDQGALEEGLEQPVLDRAPDGETGIGKRGGCQFNVVLGDHPKSTSCSGSGAPWTHSA